MKLFLIFLLGTSILLGCRHKAADDSDPKGLSAVDLISARRAQGDFEITCNDGTKETAYKEAILENDICNGKSTRQDVVCTLKFGLSIPTSTKTGATFGQGVNEVECNAEVDHARYGVVCSRTNSGYSPFRLSDGVQLGTFNNLNECLGATAGSRHSVMCAGPNSSQVQPTYIPTGQGIGDGMPLKTCLSLVSATAANTLCAYSRGQYYTADIKNGTLYGEGKSANDCIAANSSANEFAACIGRDSRFTPARSSDGTELGQPVPLETCKTLTATTRERTICAKFSNLYFPVSLASTAVLSESGDELVGCLNSLRAANYQVICTREYGSAYVPTRILDAVKLGRTMTFENCLAATQAIKGTVVCTYDRGQYYPTRIADGEVLGSGLNLKACLDSTNGAKIVLP